MDVDDFVAGRVGARQRGADRAAGDCARLCGATVVAAGGAR